MADSTPGALQLRARSAQVVDHHYDDEKPGKPLYLLIPGGLIAVASLLLIIYIAYRAFWDGTMDTGTGISLMLLLSPFYIGGVFLFAYGYELFDLSKALRDTAIIVFITLAAVVIIAVLFFVGGALGGKSSSSKSDSKSSSESKSSGESGVAGAAAGLFGGGGSSYSSGGSTYIGGGGPVFIDLGSHGVTHEVTHEVVKEVPVAPPEPQPIKCPNCGRSYIPVETKFACPNCGAPTPPDLILQSNGGSTADTATTDTPNPA